MEKILFSFLLSIFLGCGIFGLLVAIGFEILASVFFGIISSYVVLLYVYIPDMINKTSSTDVNYVLIYIICGFIVIIVSALYIMIKNNSHRCICKCCRRYNYINIDDHVTI